MVPKIAGNGRGRVQVALVGGRCREDGGSFGTNQEVKRTSLETSADRIARYRQLATEARNLAGPIANDNARAMMLEVADTLESIDLERTLGHPQSTDPLPAS